MQPMVLLYLPINNWVIFFGQKLGFISWEADRALGAVATPHGHDPGLGAGYFNRHLPEENHPVIEWEIFRILKRRYVSTIFWAIFCRDIP